ncbi:MAG: hypothetical protein IKY18_05140 [Oscillospiraceae bacterium]|nr:hypothetical protein [Oscillospiraceae bacterium]
MAEENINKQKENSSEAEDKTLKLKWYIPRFLPFTPENRNIPVHAQELLDPNNFRTPELTANYWSVPEILTEMRWVLQRAGKIDVEQDEEYFREYGGMNRAYTHLLVYFRYIVTMLGIQSAQYWKVREVLERIYQDKKAYVDYWIKYRHKLGCDISKSSENMGIIIDFLSLPELVGNQLFEEAKRHAEFLSPIVYGGWKKAEFAPQYVEFCNTVRIFFKEYLNQTEERLAGRTLYTVARWIKRGLSVFNKSADFPKADKWNAQYVKSIWGGLEQIADCLSDLFNNCSQEDDNGFCPKCLSYGDDYFSSANNMMKILNEMMQKNTPKNVDLQKLKGSRYLKDCFKQSKKKCVALLEYMEHDREKYVIAFSGYFDVRAGQKKVCDISEGSEPLGMFKIIMKELKCELVELTDQLAGYVYRLADGRKISLLDELERGDKSNKNLYSCCERKILGYLDKKKKCPSSMKFYIKKKPCDECRPVMNIWWNDHKGVTQIEVDYIGIETDCWQPSPR